MFSQVIVHNQPHGYSFTARPCYGMVRTHPSGMLSCPYFSNLKGSFTTSVGLQCYDNSAMTLQNEVATHFQAFPVISMRRELLASSQSCRSVDADAWCKRELIEQRKSKLLLNKVFHRNFCFFETSMLDWTTRPQ